MSTSPVTHPARGESLLSVDPQLLQQVDPGWRRRMSLYAGRALTDTALTAEQGYRSGRLALLSQLVSPGVGAGLDASIDQNGRIHVQPGYGFASTGEDVTLIRELVVPSWDTLQVVDAVTADFKQTFADLKKDSSQQGGAFVLMLLPVAAMTNPDPRGCVEVTGELTSSSPVDPRGVCLSGSGARGRGAARARRLAQPAAADPAGRDAGQHLPQPACHHDFRRGAWPRSRRTVPGRRPTSCRGKRSASPSGWSPSTPSGSCCSSTATPWCAAAAGPIIHNSTTARRRSPENSCRCRARRSRPGCCRSSSRTHRIPRRPI